MEGFRRGEFVSKRVTFEGVVADPALDGGAAACCVFDGTTSDDGSGGGGESRRGEGGRGGRSGERRRKRAEGPAAACGVVGGDEGTARKVSGTIAGRDSRAGHGANRAAGAASSGESEGSCEDDRHSSIMVWPGRLEAAAEAGLQAHVPYRLTCLRLTTFEARFAGARNVLLAGTREGLAVAFDWGCMLRDSGGGGRAGGGHDGVGDRGAEGGIAGDEGGGGVAGVRREAGSEMLMPSAQVSRAL